MASHVITTTTALLHTLRAGDEGAVWELFVGRYSPILRSVARRLGLSEEDAADVAQQTLLEFVRDMRAGGFDRGRGRLRSWIVSIAEHRSRDILRRARTVSNAAATRPGAVGETCDLEAIGGSLEARATLERWWDEEERAHVARVAWEQLKEGDRGDATSLQVFELVALRDVPPAEAARQMGMRIESVYAAKYRVAERLRAAIARLSAAYEADLS